MWEVSQTRASDDRPPGSEVMGVGGNVFLAPLSQDERVFVRFGIGLVWLGLLGSVRFW